MLDSRAVVPAAVEEHDLASRREMFHVALQIHLRLLTLGRGGESDDTEDARADPLGDGFDAATLAGGVAPFEDDHGAEARLFGPRLQLHQLDLERLERLLVFLVTHRLARRAASIQPC